MIDSVLFYGMPSICGRSSAHATWKLKEMWHVSKSMFVGQASCDAHLFWGCREPFSQVVEGTYRFYVTWVSSSFVKKICFHNRQRNRLSPSSTHKSAGLTTFTRFLLLAFRY